MTVSWCRCGRYQWADPDCTLPLKRCLHERCEARETCQIIEWENE